MILTTTQKLLICNVISQLPRGINGLWETRRNVKFQVKAPMLGDECSIFGCYWYKHVGKWKIVNGSAQKDPDQVIVMRLQPQGCIIG